MYNQNRNVFTLPNLGENLTDEDQVAFHMAGLPLPSFAHGPRDCTADYYAADDRSDAETMRYMAYKAKAERQEDSYGYPPSRITQLLRHYYRAPECDAPIPSESRAGGFHP